MSTQQVEHQSQVESSHTMVVRMSFDPLRRQEVIHHLEHDVVTFARRQTGFVSGRWLSSADGSQGLGVVVFQTAAQANVAAQGPRGSKRDETRSWNIDSVDVYGQVAID